MGKRSSFTKIDKDFYSTIDPNAVRCLKPLFHLIDPEVHYYAEPCYGSGSLHKLLDSEFGSDLECNFAADLDPPDNHCIARDAFELTAKDIADCDAIITNPPWTRSVLHPMIEHFVTISEKPVWLLFDADWSQTIQSIDLIEKYCTDILAVGRLKWIPETKMSGKDNASWYRFAYDKDRPVNFYPRVRLTKLPKSGKVRS